MLVVLVPPTEKELQQIAGSHGCGITQIEELLIDGSIMLDSSSEVKYFAKSLRNGVSVRRLYMESSGISDDILIEFTKHWSLDSSITDLGLSGNDITFGGVRGVLERTCAPRCALKVLDLSENVNVGYSGMACIGDMLRLVQLTDLSLNNCIGDEQVASLLEDPSTRSHIREEAFQALARGLRQNLTLKNFI
jgi:hypothetical protein